MNALLEKVQRSLVERSLRHGKAVTEKLRIPLQDQTPVPDDAYLLVLFFNLESVWGFGHCVLGLGPAKGDIQTYSFYRRSSKIIAPAKVASMVAPMPFEQIREQSGWITHGIADDIWNEHMSCCFALWCTQDVYEKVFAHITAIKEDPGTYRLLTRNCVHIVLQSLASGGVHLLSRKGIDIKTIIPRRAYEQAIAETDAKPYKAERYWFKVTPPPKNGYKSRKLIVDDNV